MLTYSKRIIYVGLLVVLFHHRFISCKQINNSSEIRLVGELSRNWTKFDDGANLGRTTLLHSNITVIAPYVNNTTTENEHNGSMVFYQSDQKLKKKPRTNSSVLPKLLTNSSSSLPTVGEGLDLAKASILPKRSSPSVIPSCLGNQVTLKCAAEGNPAPDFTWYKGKQTVNREKVSEFDLDIKPSLFARASHLTFIPKIKDDFGDYECAATNTLGSSQQSIHKIKVMDKGKGVCAQSTNNNNDKRKYNSIVIGTISSVGMLLMILFIAGFVFWRLNQQEADAYQSLEKSKENNEASVQADNTEVASSEQNNQSSSKEYADEEDIHDDFNAKEIGRLSTLLAGDWEKLARLLGFHQHDVNAIRENSDKIESRCAEMLNRFRRRQGSRETLAESVEELKDIETASAIRQKYYKSNPTE